MSETKTNEELTRTENVKELLMKKVKLSEELIATDKVLKDVRLSCDHRLVKDRPGFLYDFRSCAICGEDLGLV